MRTESINISNIDMGDRARKEYKNIIGLADSLKKFGTIHNIAVREISAGKYELLAGGRRITAAKQLGWTTITANIYEEGEAVTEVKSREIELEENLQRENLSWQEECLLKKEILRLKQELYGTKGVGPGGVGVSAADVAGMIGETPQNLSLDLQLADAIELIPELKGAKNKAEARRLVMAIGKQLNIESASKQLEIVEAVTEVDVLKKKLADSYIIRDAIENLREIPSGSISLLDVDPPFAIDLKNVKKLKEKAVGLTLDRYNEMPSDGYKEFLDTLFSECFRVLEDSGWMLVWFGPEPWFEPTYAAIIGAGFACKRIPIIWNKTGEPGQTLQPDMYLANNYEMVFYARKSLLSSINKKGRSNIFSFDKVTPSAKIHPTEKPIELMMEMINTFVLPAPHKTVLTPFAGSGNTLLAAANLGMNAIGTDLGKQYRDGYVSRIATQPYRKYRSYK